VTIPERHPVECIGTSMGGIPLLCAHCGRADAPLRIMVIAGQHGDERHARKAAWDLLERCTDLEKTLPAAQLAMVPDANPDGSTVTTRHNAAGIDLNRDHQRLDAPETRALHGFVRRWQPQVVIDAHNYPSRRRHLLARNLVLDHDVFIDGPTHPAIAHPLAGAGFEALLRAVTAQLNAAGITGDRYVLTGPSGAVRHSTVDVVDARNGLALRYGLLGLIVEGRAPRRDDARDERKRLVQAHAEALLAILRWLAGHATALTPPAALEKVHVPVRFRYAESAEGFDLALKDLGTGERTCVHSPRYARELEITRLVEAPVAYAVPEESAALLTLLERHGFQRCESEPGNTYLVERYDIIQVRTPKGAARAAQSVVVQIARECRTLNRFTLFPAMCAAGRALAVFLEPESKYGLHRYEEMELPLSPGAAYPVLRVVA
jgi:Zinc carboxypeptidase